MKTHAWHEFEFSPPGVSVEHPCLRHFANITNMFTVKIKHCDLHRNKHSLAYYVYLLYLRL